ncbi:hypothetical protein [Corynebacterium auriscanis]|nr:hypothetical protein [Corynebacterium auriscanis]WJY72635.1 hypothetical protein CAURIC_04985 [Corynebacterium auriscanis]
MKKIANLATAVAVASGLALGGAAAANASEPTTEELRQQYADTLYQYYR